MATDLDPSKLCDLYLRRSKLQDDKTTLRKHEKDLRAWADRAGLSVRKIWLEEVSAFKAGVVREEFDKALAAVAAGEVKTLLVWKLDRLSRRGMGQVGFVLDKFEAISARLVAFIDGLDSSISQHRGLFAWLAEQARSESYNISVRTTSTKAEKKLSGRWPGGQAPYGLRVKGGRTKHNKKEYLNARLIATSLLDGMATGPLAEKMNSMEVKTRRGAQWRSSSITQLVRSPAFAGLMPVFERYIDTSGRDRWRPTNEPLLNAKGKPVRVGKGVVTPAERLLILAKLRSRTSESLASGRRGKPAAQSLLSSYAKCGRCGGPMTKSGQQYRCYKRVNMGKSVCQGMTVLVKDADSVVEAAFMARVSTFTSESEIYRALALRWLAYDNPEANARREELITAADDASTRLERLDGAYFVKGQFKDPKGDERYAQMRGSIETQLAAIKMELDEISKNVNLSVLRDPQRIKQEWTSADLNQARQLLGIVMHSVTILPPRGQGCKRSWFELYSDLCFHWVGEKQQPLRRGMQDVNGVTPFLPEEVYRSIFGIVA